MRPQLYMFASGLFAQPTREYLKILRVLLEKLLLETQMPWHNTLIALKQEMDYDEELEAEYSRLFILGLPQVPAQPFGSFWLERSQQLLGDSTLEIKKMMAENGIEIAENSGLLPDHIVSELEFMAYLASQEETKQRQQQLFEQHLDLWIPQFTAALLAANPLPRYRLAAEFIEQLFAWERKELIT